LVFTAPVVASLFATIPLTLLSSSRSSVTVFFNPVANKFATTKFQDMKKTKFLFLASFLASTALFFSGCLKDKCTNNATFTEWIPIYVSDADFRPEPKMQAARALKNPGKIYFYDKYMLINEVREGIHIIDNSNVQSPQNIGFINVAGNIDIAVKGNILYADSYMDLLSIDISNIQQPKLVKRNQEVFQGSFWRDPTRGWLVGYNPQQVTKDFDCNDPRLNNGSWFIQGDRVFTSCANCNMASSFPASATQSKGAVPTTGTGGSMARITLMSDYLYAINNSQVQVYDVKKLSDPILASSFNVAWGIETLFPFGDKLFIGSMTGMFIFDVTNPLRPTQLSIFTHARVCDPVVAEGKTAYVTLRNGSTCQGFNNQLEVVDITSLTAPKLVKIYPMKNPRGLSVLDKTLYLCDDGFKIYDVTNANEVDKNLKAHIAGFDTYDVIVYYNGKQKVAMVIGKDGFYQFDVTSSSQPKELSKIPVVK
jgi:hypothetical protein